MLKRSKDAFSGTQLESILCEMKVDRLVIVGYVAEYCIAATYQTAFDLGYHPIILSDGVAGMDQDAQAIRTMKSTSATALPTVLEREKEIHHG